MHRTLRPSATVRASISEDGLVLLDLAGGLVLSANAVGGRIWTLIEQQGTPARIALQIAADYSIDPDRATQDVAAFIAALRTRGLVEDGE